MRIRGRNAYKSLSLLIGIIIILIIFVNLFTDKTLRDELLTQLPDLKSFDANQEEELPQTKDINAQQLINLTDFHYTINNSICAKYDLLAIIIVTSYAGHDELRAAHRQAITQTKLSELGLQRIFLLAELAHGGKHFITQQQIVSEQQKFGDLLQGSFMESYRNLSYKHIMGLRWAALECNKAKFIIKIDDDTVYDVFHLKNYMESLELKGYRNNFLAGFVLTNMLPIRVTANKWYVSPDEYAATTYPDYLSGWLYLTNPDTALRLVYESQSAPFFWIDDTWITGVLRERVRVPLVHLNAWYSANAEFIDCCVRDLKRSNYECEFYIGPNGGDTKLIVEFLHNVEKCYFDECLKRTPEKSLRQTCVAAVKHLLPEHGESFLRAIKLR